MQEAYDRTFAQFVVEGVCLDFWGVFGFFLFRFVFLQEHTISVDDKGVYRSSFALLDHFIKPGS